MPGPVRLITNPKCYVYVKDADENVRDISTYVVGGRVERLIDQVSNAQIQLRNPNKIFTNPAQGVAFHPMDPITIYLERIKGYPVQVFTGFLDETPYYQMFPGTITIKASCTLKRLLYTFFDPALPFFISFMKQFGWTIYEDGTVVNLPALGETENNVTKEEKEKKLEKHESESGHTGFSQKELESKNLIPFGANAKEDLKKSAGNDSSLSLFLWALLYYVAGIRDENIYIEAIPPEVAQLIVKIFNNFKRGQAQTETEEKLLETFFKEFIGVGGQGSAQEAGASSTESGNLTGVKQITETMTKIANHYHLPPAFVCCVSLSECGWQQSEVNKRSSEGAIGWFQFEFKNVPQGGTYNPYGEGSYTEKQAKDTATATDAFCKHAVKVAAENPSFRKERNWEAWATKVQGSAGYAGHWELQRAKEYVSKYGNARVLKNEELHETAGGQLHGSGTRGAGAKAEKAEEANNQIAGLGGRTRIKAMEEEATAITKKHYPYAYGGGHHSAGTPSTGTETENGGSIVTGFDCSGSVAAVLVAGGFIKAGSEVPGSGSFGQYQSKDTRQTSTSESGSKPEVTVYHNSKHAWMTINGREFSTSPSRPRGGAGWGSTNPATWPQPITSYESFSYTAKSLEQPHTEPAPPLTGKSEAGGETGAESPLVDAKAAAFNSQISFPSIAETLAARLLKGQRALMNDVSLFSFIQQVTQASLRSFMSLPNGDFFAFYPDYFGEMGHHEAYWEIPDLEILSGGINLTDSNLATHVYCVGDTIWPASQEKLINELKSKGVVDIFNAFESETVHKTNPTKKREATLAEGNTAPFGPGAGGGARVMSIVEARKFLERYGARPVVLEMPMIRSHLYEMLMAYQGFCLGWSRQFQTPFEFTFMPELYPGGKVAFSDHGIQMYIESVTHEWDLETGFTTNATLTAPSLTKSKIGANANQLPPDMVNALTNPVETKAA